MAFAQVGSGTYAGSASTLNPAVAKPSGVAEGDIMFILVNRGTTGTNITPPAGWSEIARNVATYCWHLYYKVAGASEGETYQFTWLANTKTALFCCAFRDGFDTADPIQTSSNTAYTTNDTNLRGASVTLTEAGPVLLIGSIYNTSSRTFSAPGDFTEAYDYGHTDPDFWASFNWRVYGSTGATGTIDATISDAQNGVKHAFVVALNPEAAAAAVKNTMLMGVG